MLPELIDDKGNIRLSKLIPPDFRDMLFINFKGRYRVAKGARNTGKSHTIIGFEPLIKLIDNPLRNIVIVRKNANSNKQSTFDNLCGRIYDLGLEKHFKMRENPSPEITYLDTGQQIIFRGMNDPTTLNSLTFAHGYLTDVYIEEAFEIESYSDFRKLDGSLRAKLPKGLFLQITLCFNAWSKEHWLYERFFKGLLEDDYAKLDDPAVSSMTYKDENWQGDFGKGLYLHISTYKANPFRDKEAIDPAAEATKIRSPDEYAVEFLGMWGNSTASTYPEFKDANIMSLAQIKSKFRFATYAIGVDTGLSNGEGGKRTVGRNQKVEERVKSAHAVMLVGVTDDFENIVVLDEYYHTEIERNGEYNTDEAGSIGIAKLLSQTVKYILNWERKYSQEHIGILEGTIPIYVDSADQTFRQMLDDSFRSSGITYCDVYSSTKLSVQTRVDFEKIMMAWGNFIVCDQCKNTIREFRNARRGDKGQARTDGDDHALTSLEYGYTPLLPDVHRWATFKPRSAEDK